MARASETTTIFTCDICNLTHDSGTAGLPAGWKTVTIRKIVGIGYQETLHDIHGDCLATTDPALLLKFRNLIAG